MILLVVAFLLGIGIGILLIYLGWQIYSGNTKYYQLLYGQVLGKKDKDEYIAKHHQSFGILYIVVGIVIDVAFLLFQFKYAGF